MNSALLSAFPASRLLRDQGCVRSAAGRLVPESLGAADAGDTGAEPQDEGGHSLQRKGPPGENQCPQLLGEAGVWKMSLG